jgi:hypothetical protein
MDEFDLPRRALVEKMSAGSCKCIPQQVIGTPAPTICTVKVGTVPRTCNKILQKLLTGLVTRHQPGLPSSIRYWGSCSTQTTLKASPHSAHLTK